MEATSPAADKMEQETRIDGKKKKIFVAGSTGKTGKRIVEQLLSKGFEVRAGALDIERARSSLPQDPNVQIVSLKTTNFPSLW